MENKKYKQWFWILAVLTTVLVFSLSYYGYQKVIEVRYQTQQIASLTDTVTLYKTKVASGAKRKILTGSRSEVLTVLKATDKKTYEIVNKTKDVHTYSQFSTSVKIDTTVKAVVTIQKDSTGKPSVVLSKVITEPKNYYQADIIVRGDSLGLRVAMTDKYHIVSSEKSNGFFKPKSYVVSVENENPYITIDSVKSFEIKPKNKVKTGVKVGVVSIGLATAAYFILKKH
jgi:hypothetical protein